MKQIVFIAGILLAVAGTMTAGDAVPFTIVNKVASTNSATAPKLNGFLEAIKIDVTGTTTQTLTFTSARTGETLLTKAYTADAVVRPRLAVQTTAGADIGVNTNDFVKFLLVNDAVAVTCAETAPVTNSTTITIFTSKD